jgi:predicted MFS family arabinose efflux permease
LAVQPLSGFAICTFYLLPKFMTKELHATASEIGVVSTVYGLASVVAIPFLAWAIDRGSPRRLIMTAAFALSASASGYLAVHQFGPLLLALRLVQGLAWALTFTAGMMMTTTLAPAPRLAQAIGYYGSANLAMNAVAPGVAETIADSYGWRPAFVLASAAGLFGFLIARGLPDVVAGRAESTTAMWNIASRPRSLWMAAVATVWGAAFGAMFTFSQPFALQLGVTHVRGFFIAYTAAALFSRLGIGSLADRAGRLRVAVGALALYATVVLAMQHLRAGWLATIGAFFGLAHGLFFPAFSALTLARFPNGDRGKLTALSNGAFCGGIALSGALFGPLAEHSGYPSVFLVAGLATWGAVAMLASGRV